jgi:hypothetical protein
MGLLDELEKHEIENMCGRGKVEDGRVPGDQSYPPDTS